MDTALPPAPQSTDRPEPRPAPPVGGGSMVGSAVRGSAWTVGGYAAGQLGRLLGNLVLTRLLFPAVFGQMALINVFMQGLQMFSDVGTGPAIVQSRRGDDPDLLNTAWTIQSIRGVLLWLGSWAIAVPVAGFFGQPLLVWLIPAAGFSAVLGGLEATSMHTLQRHLRLKELTLVDLVSQVVGIAVAIVGAFADRRLYGENHAGAAWVFVGANLVAALTRTVLSHLALPGIRHRFRLERAALGELLGFGRWVFVSTLLTFLAGQADRLIFGKMIPLDLFGVYGIAATLAMLPTLAVLKVGSSVAFPAYARLAARGGLGTVIGRVRLPLLLGGGAIVTGLLACGPGLIGILYDARYAQAGWILQFLAASAWFQILEATCGAALLALGRVPWMAAGSAAKVASLVVLIPLGFHLDGFRGALAGMVLAEAVKYLVAAIGVAVVRMPGLRLDAGVTALVAAVSAAGLVTGGLVDSTTHSTLAAFSGAALVSGGIWVAILAWYLLRERARRALPAILAALALVLPGEGGAAPRAPRSLGVNLAAVNDWDPSLMFADAMRSARHFGPVGQPWDEKAAVDARGWPTGDAGVVVMVGLPHMGGTYKLSFTGRARPRAVSTTDARTRVTRVAYDAGSNTSTADVVVGAAEQNLFLTFVGQAGGVKNVRLMRPGHGPAELFSQPFLARLARFQVLRFMDFSQTNWNPQVTWADRNLPGNASQQRRPDGATVGAAWEYVVLLANQTGKDVWINLPHQANDDYVTRLARLLRFGSDGVNPYSSAQANPVFPPLDAGRKVYVEWSNEVWNGGFSQSAWAGARADAAIAANDPDLLYDGNTNHYAVLFRYVGKRSMEVSNLFRAVFGDAAMMTRVRPVLPAQIANAGTLSEPLAYLAARHGGASSFFYAAAGAPYVTVNDDDAGTRTGLTLDTIFAEMTSYAEVNVHTWMNTFSALCAQHGIRMVAYEGGQHLYGTGSTDVKIAAQLDPRMKDIILLNYSNWSAAGGDLFVHYNLCSAWNRYGAWGLSSDITSEATPKWEAVAQIAAAAR